MGFFFSTSPKKQPLKLSLSLEASDPWRHWNWQPPDHWAFSFCEMQNHPGTLSSKSCSLASGHPSITAKATCFLSRSLALRCSPPTNATFSAPFRPERKGNDLRLYKVLPYAGSGLFLQPRRSKAVSQGHQVAVRANGFSFSFFPSSWGTLGFAGGGAGVGNVNLVGSWEHEALASVVCTEDSSRGSHGDIW